MKLLVLFALSSCALARGWGCRPAPRYPFLREVSQKARIEFRGIINNQSLPRHQVEKNLEEWAKKSDVKESYEKFVSTTEEEMKQTQTDIKEALEKLIEFFEKLSAIENNKDLTVPEARANTLDLYDKLKRRTANAASCVANAFRPEFQCDDDDDYDGDGGFRRGGRWRGMGRGPCCGRGRFGRSTGERKSPPSFSSFLENIGFGYPWHSGSYSSQ